MPLSTERALTVAMVSIHAYRTNCLNEKKERSFQLVIACALVTVRYVLKTRATALILLCLMNFSSNLRKEEENGVS